MKKISLFLMAVALMGCTHHTYTVTNQEAAPEINIMQKLPPRGGDKNVLAFLPEATAFRMNGNYAKNVAITLSPSGEVTYYPDPTDLTADSEPIELCDGWWLNNQGIGPNSVFTKYTFAEYASLPQAPTIEQLKAAVIPGSHVTGFIELPMKVGEANQNIEEAKKFVKGK